ncbi:MAG: hypothetical protein J7L82_02020 [Staphylothermus sp.]|nr:hypothetical protein [Staphylothermus sp.]
MNQVIIDVNMLVRLLATFRSKESEDGLFKHERAFFKGGAAALQQILIDNNLEKVVTYEEFPKESSI